MREIFFEIYKLCKLRGGNFLFYDIRWNFNGDEVVLGNLLKLNLDYIFKSFFFFYMFFGRELWILSIYGEIFFLEKN